MSVIFGYIICNKEGLKEEELQRYQAMYCGLCQAIKERHGQLARFSLNFDMTFLAIFLTALYEPEESVSEFRCPFHPFHKKLAVRNQFMDYAADMTIALSFHKCMDDWKDEGKRSRLQYSRVLTQKYDNVKELYPRQCQMIENSLRALEEIEKSQSALPDQAVNCSGMMLSEVFVYREDYWSDRLRTLGYELGRFIYLMDAAMDYEKDRKKDNYNPLFSMGKKPEEIVDLLTMAIGNVADQFEQLPIIKDEGLIRNIIYGGVWQKYYTLAGISHSGGKGKKDGNGSI